MDPNPTKGDRTRHALLDRGRDPLRPRGLPAHLGCRRVSRRGVSSTASYPYFGTKEALFVAAVDQDVAGLIDDAVSLVVLDEEPDQWARL